MVGRQAIGRGALAAAVACALAACGGGGGSPAASTGSGSPAAGRPDAGSTSVGSTGAGSMGNAAVTGIVNPSAAQGGTLVFDLSGRPDSTDYQNTSYLYMWDLARLYSTPLVTYRSCPGRCGLQLVPGLATSLGTPSDGYRVWTYHLKPNVKFQNGHRVTAADVKYGIERTFAKRVLSAGPIYYQVLLQDSFYPGPYVDRARNVMGLTSITTPDPSTVVFHLNQPFADFNYVAAIPQSAPVEPSWDTGAHGGANFQLNPESTGPYQFEHYALNKQLTLVPNKYWNAATDPQARQLASRIVVDMGMTQPEVDQDLIAGHAQLDLRGAGAPADRILSSPALKANADSALTGFLRFAYINTQVVPNVHCRAAIEYAADKTALQAAYGGPEAGGQIASTVLPPTVLGYRAFDLYQATTRPGGDIEDARAELRKCGKPGGFGVSIAYRSDQPGDQPAATALQAALRRAGIRATLRGFPETKYFTFFAGVPTYVHAHDIGVALGTWGADWPDGFGFLYDLSDGSAIIPAGNSNIAEINDPVINNLFSRAMTAPSATAVWPKIDLQIMKDAAILPIVYQKVLLYRPPDLTNVFVQDVWGSYDYAVLGRQQ